MPFCQNLSSMAGQVCWYENKHLTHVQQLFCTLTDFLKRPIVHFSLLGSTSLMSLTMKSASGPIWLLMRPDPLHSHEEKQRTEKDEKRENEKMS